MRLAWLCALAAACSCGGAGNPHHALRGPVVRDIPPPSPPPVAPTLADGPLSPRSTLPDPSWQAQRAWSDRAEKIYLDAVALREDGARFTAIVDAMFAPPATQQEADGVDIVHRETSTLERIAPYSLDSTRTAFQQMSERLPICIRAPELPSRCWHDDHPSATTPAAPVEITASADGIVRVAIGDLSNAGDPAWAALAPEHLAHARAILLDLRAATGSDPRPLIPWLERVTGRAPLRPLREIRRAAALAPYVADYAAQYPAATSRDAAVWSALVDATPAAAPAAQHAAPLPPISIVVGASCGAACELAARVLQTYAGAIVYGERPFPARLARDEPARLVLPHSQLHVFFFATAYALNADIEAATGPTPDWHQVDSPGDVLAFAERELAQRLAGTTPPRCDALPAYASLDRMPPALHAKVTDDSFACPGEQQISLTKADAAPRSALARFLATCKRPLALASGSFLPRDLDIAAISQLAQSELVASIRVECAVSPHVDRFN